ncbi:hypothetical protein [Lacticaseibacillus parakribbianus]|uniref:hypothetical protein n=1 Tax=Lacticaseibacillus parakribbianus TaxID=2970927 RepID=UPI0021CB5BC6|nr:hypothetical protein [Lacticaseibacillus parakribbianus]
MKELKDNSITVKGSILSMQEKTVNKGQVVDLHIRIPIDQLLPDVRKKTDQR